MISLHLKFVLLLLLCKLIERKIAKRKHLLSCVEFLFGSSNVRLCVALCFIVVVSGILSPTLDVLVLLMVVVTTTLEILFELLSEVRVIVPEYEMNDSLESVCRKHSLQCV